MSRRVVIVGFDGLRPDFVRPDVTPNLCRLAQFGIRFARHRSVFPTETRVNLTSLGTGAWPAAHGIIGNKFHDRVAAPDTWLDSGDAGALEAAYPEGLSQAGSLGQTLFRAGQRLAVIGTGSAGATRMLSPHAPELGLLSLACASLATSYPPGEVRTIVDRFGAPPARTIPGSALIDWATTVFLDHVWPALRPDVAILWFAEPDSSAHYLGLGSAATRDALAAADAAFGRLLAWWQTQPDVRLMVVSDHGHVAQAEAVSAAAALAGFGLASEPADRGAVGCLLPGHVGRIYLRRPDHGLLDALVAALAAQPWCGHLLARDHCVPPGCLKLSLLQAEHGRAPDLTYTLRADDAETQPELPGRVWFDGDIGPGAGYHGGLQRRETNSLLMAAGDGLRQGAVSCVPSGIADIAPTVLHWLGLETPVPAGGRVLREAETETAPAWHEETLTAARGAYHQAVRRLHVGTNVYIDEGWVGGAE